MICIGPVCIPIAALYGVLPVIYLLWDKILGFLSIFFPSLKKAPKSNTPEELARLKAGTKGGVSDVDDEERWDELLAETKEIGMPLIADFGGKFCAPCKKIKPFVDELAAEFTKCRFVYVDAEDLSEVALDRYGVVALPTFKVFKWGEEVDSITGLEGEALKTALQELAAKHTPTLKA